MHQLSVFLMLSFISFSQAQQYIPYNHKDGHKLCEELADKRNESTLVGKLVSEGSDSFLKNVITYEPNVNDEKQNDAPSQTITTKLKLILKLNTNMNNYNVTSSGFKSESVSDSDRSKAENYCVIGKYKSATELVVSEIIKMWMLARSTRDANEAPDW